MEVTRDALGGSDERDEVFGDVHGFDRAEVQALEARVVEDEAQEFDEICARKKIAAVTAQMNSAEYDFAIAAGDKSIQFFDDASGREAAAISANERNHAEGAAMIAAVLYFERGTRVLRFAAFDGRDENVGQREDVTNEDRRGAWRGGNAGGDARHAE